MPFSRTLMVVAAGLAAVAGCALALLAIGAPTFSGTELVSAANPTCSPNRAHVSGTSDETVATSQGLRSYRLHVPPSYTGSDAVPLVLSFHGLTLNATFQEAYSAFSARADQPDGGFIVVYLEGVVTTGIAASHYNSWQLASPEPDDVVVVDELLNTLLLELCIDENRVYSTGFSNGGMMSVRLACSLSNRIAAIGTVAGLYYPPLALDLNALEDCSAQKAMPIIAFHGTSDAIVLFGGGVGGGLPGLFTVTARLPVDDATPADDTMAEWASHNNCTSGRQSSSIGAQVNLVRYDTCDDSSVVELYVVDGGGHTWPGSSIDLPVLGKVTNDIDATDLMWSFFQNYSLGDPGDTDGDGCSDQRENGPDETQGGLRDDQNRWDWYDINKDGVIDLFNDILGVINHYSLDGSPPYDANFDRGPSAGPNPWNMTPPDGVIDLFVDILGVINQHGHDCS